jgi:hypothetical protein
MTRTAAKPAHSRAQRRQRQVAWTLYVMDGLLGNLRGILSDKRSDCLEDADKAILDETYEALLRRRNHLAARHPIKPNHIWRAK